MSCAIRLYAACMNCDRRRPRRVSREEWSLINVGLTDSGIQIWCRRCNLEIAHFTPGELTKQLETGRCSCCPGGVHVN